MITIKDKNGSVLIRLDWHWHVAASQGILGPHNSFGTLKQIITRPAMIFPAKKESHGSGRNRG